jgi:hypothetical protein
MDVVREAGLSDPAFLEEGQRAVKAVARQLSNKAFVEQVGELCREAVSEPSRFASEML